VVGTDGGDESGWVLMGGAGVVEDRVAAAAACSVCGLTRVTEPHSSVASCGVAVQPRFPPSVASNSKVFFVITQSVLKNTPDPANQPAPRTSRDPRLGHPVPHFPVLPQIPPQPTHPPLPPSPLLLPFVVVTTMAAARVARNALSAQLRRNTLQKRFPSALTRSLATPTATFNTTKSTTLKNGLTVRN
jgi:hypothetical protein